jgi:hypothetical protein
MLLNFSGRTRTGVFNMVWPLTKKELLIGYCKANNEQNRKEDKAALPRTVVFKGIDLA